VRLLDLFRTTTFRWTLTISVVFVTAALILVGVIYRQAVTSNEARVDALLLQEARSILEDSPNNASARMQERLNQDPRRIRFAGLFDSQRRPIFGNFLEYPKNFEPDMTVWKIISERRDLQGSEIQSAHAVGGILNNGNHFIVARSFDDIEPLEESIRATMINGLVPAIALALICGVILSMRTQNRINEIHRRAERIMAGHLHERLPNHGTRADFDKLAEIINEMLDQIENLMSAVKGVGDDIAHDLRTPLTRVRASLERGRENARSLDDLRQAVDKGITGIDQALGVTGALLRIASIEHSQRNSGFGEVDLGAIVAAAIELYEPAAEDKGVTLYTAGIDKIVLRGDRDLLFEVVSNLVDNAIKFTPAGGQVKIELLRTQANVLLRVSDTGPGIPAAEREAVFRRFYRTDKSRNTAGMGLGLSLVAAITRLHGFRVQVADTLQGCTIEVMCGRQSAS
jgi:signal transduction histidine kinase